MTVSGTIVRLTLLGRMALLGVLVETGVVGSIESLTVITLRCIPAFIVYVLCLLIVHSAISAHCSQSR